MRPLPRSLVVPGWSPRSVINPATPILVRIGQLSGSVCWKARQRHRAWRPVGNSTAEPQRLSGSPRGDTNLRAGNSNPTNGESGSGGQSCASCLRLHPITTTRRSNRCPPLCSPRSSERRSGVWLQLAACDHVLQRSGNDRVLVVEYIPKIMQLTPSPLDFVGDVSECQGAQDQRNHPSSPVEQIVSPACRSIGYQIARLVMHHDLDRPRDAFPTKVGTYIRLKIGRTAVGYQKARKRLQSEQCLLRSAQ
jgi:hypothetical protein